MSGGITLPSVAFPTVSPTDTLPPKSLLVDVLADAVVSAAAIYATYPIAERKGKSKTGYVAVHPTLFEIHKSQKDFKAKKLAKYFIDFANVFNVCIQNEPVQIKGDCISIMEPADTYLFRPTDSEYSLEAWYEYILEKARECRCNKLARPVFHEEYFEAAWDVMVIKKPKLKKEYGSQQEHCDDLAIKRPSMEGRRRLCICSTSFLLFDMEAKPTYNPDAAFPKHSFIDLPVNVISNYGCQEKFFFIRIGRCSEIGSGELWMSSESGSAAKAMHERINSINIRESDKRRVLGVKINYPTISSRVLKSRAHRERSQTANQLQKSESNSKLRVGQGLSDSDKTSKNSSCRSMATTLTNVSSNHSLNATNSKSVSGSESGGKNAPEGSIFNTSSGSCLSSIPEKVRDDITSNSSPQPKKNSIAGLLPFRLSRMSNTSMSSTDQQPPLHSPSFSHPDSMMLSAAAANRLSASMKHSKLGSRHLQGSGSKLDRISLDKCQPSQYNCAEDYMTYDASDSGIDHLSNFKSFAGADQSRKSSATYSGIFMNHLPGRQYSMGSNSMPISDSQQRMGAGSSSTPKDYLEMDVNILSSNLYRPEMVFPLQEVRSYISNSTESCWSPHSSEGTSNAPRAYSLGSKPTKLSTQRHRELEEEEEANRAISSVSVTLPPGCSASLQPHNCLSPPRNRPTTTPNDSNTSLSPSANVPGDKQGNPPVSSTIVNWRGGVAAANTAATALDTEDMRKRAHSVGSKSWIKQAASLRKMSAKKNVVASSSTAETPRTEATASGALESEARDRADSTGSRTSSLFGVNANFDSHSRRNTNRSSASHPDSHDHVEIDFDRDGSCASIESPLNRSRNSSVGVQMPSSVRAALDLALSANHHHRMLNIMGEKPSDRFINLGKAELTAKSSNGDEPLVVRKRSVPEMTVLDTNNCNTSNHSSHQQPTTSQRRRSTYDCTAASSLSAAAHLARFRAKANTNHHLLHPATSKPVSSGRFTSLSTSSGISSRSSEPSIATLPLQISAPDYHQQPLEDDEDDYVMMGGGGSGSENTQTSTNSQQPRLISTIIESAYSSSTTSLNTSCESSESASEAPEPDQQVKSKPVAVPHLLVKSKEMPLSKVVIEKRVEKVEEDHEDYGIIVHPPVAAPKTAVKKEVRDCKARSPGRSPMFVGQKSGAQGPAKGPSTSPGRVQRKISCSRDEPDHAVDFMNRKMTYGGSTGCPMMVDSFRKHSSSSCSPQTAGKAAASRKHKAVVVMPEKMQQCDYAVVKPSVAEGGGRRE